jgi:hypothetical protein
MATASIISCSRLIGVMRPTEASVVSKDGVVWLEGLTRVKSGAMELGTPTPAPAVSARP